MTYENPSLIQEQKVIFEHPSIDPTILIVKTCSIAQINDLFSGFHNFDDFKIIEHLFKVKKKFSNIGHVAPGDGDVTAAT